MAKLENPIYGYVYRVNDGLECMRVACDYTSDFVNDERTRVKVLENYNGEIPKYGLAVKLIHGSIYQSNLFMNERDDALAIKLLTEYYEDVLNKKVKELSKIDNKLETLKI